MFVHLFFADLLVPDMPFPVPSSRAFVLPQPAFEATAEVSQTTMETRKTSKSHVMITIRSQMKGSLKISVLTKAFLPIEVVAESAVRGLSGRVCVIDVVVRKQ